MTVWAVDGEARLQSKVTDIASRMVLSPKRAIRPERTVAEDLGQGK
jgi:hypothetical protein